MLSKEAQEIPWRFGDSYQLPTNIYAQPAPGFTPADKLKLIDMNFIKFGSDKEGKRLINNGYQTLKKEVKYP